MWNRKIDEFLVKIGFHRLESDHSIYLRSPSGSTHKGNVVKNLANTAKNDIYDIVALYVDDLILLTKTKASMTTLKNDLSKSFEMTDCGEIHHFLGINATRDRSRRSISLDQSHFATNVVDRFGLTNCHPVSTPLDPSIKLVADAPQSPHQASVEGENASEKSSDELVDPTFYRQIVGSLMYLMIGTRPDLAAAIGIISQFSANPRKSHLGAAKRILRYLKGTINLKLKLGNATTATATTAATADPATTIKISGYSDANWGNDINTRRSTSGYIFYIAGGVVSWSSKRQATVALSSTEAEYMALTHATKETVWLRALLGELGFHQGDPSTIFEDNQSCIALARNPVHHARTKHIDIRHHYIREKLESGEVTLRYVNTKEMVADAFTKPLPKPQFEFLVGLMNLCTEDGATRLA